MILKKISQLSVISYQLSIIGSPKKVFLGLRSLIYYLLITVYCSMINGCGIYIFNSSSIDYEKIKTISVLNFTMATAGGPANLPLQLNEKLKEYYQRNTKLRVVPNNGDMVLEGTITGYEILAAAPTSQDQAALNRLTVTVEVKFTNNKDEAKNFEQSFSFYQDYPQNQTLSQNETRLVPKILDQIIQDIFNISAGDW